MFVDGTFKTAPHPYYQLLTIHGLCNDCVFPLIYCLLTGKSTGQYRQIFRRLRMLVHAQSSRQWRPVTAVCDFKVGIITALETEFTGVTVRCCYFHFTQSLWRKVSTLGMAASYRRQNRRCRRLRKCIQMVMAIGYLPVAHVQHAFTTFCGSRQMTRLTANFPNLAVFIRYVARTYVTAGATFSASMWNVFNRDISIRTNNQVERYVYALIQCLGSLSSTA
jgi:MULE transposase domain